MYDANLCWLFCVEVDEQGIQALHQQEKNVFINLFCISNMNINLTLYKTNKQRILCKTLFWGMFLFSWPAHDII